MSEDMKNPSSVKKILPLALGAVAIAGGSFFGGMQYANHAVAASAATRQARFAQGGNGAVFFRGGTGGTRTGGGFVIGQILSNDDKSITLSTPGGGSKTVYLSDTTQVLKADAGTLADLAVGQQVMTTGTPNSDGSVTASSVQIRPDQPPAAVPKQP
jgi:hypothetical protein